MKLTDFRERFGVVKTHELEICRSLVLLVMNFLFVDRLPRALSKCWGRRASTKFAKGVLLLRHVR